jgi:hypothetical protein
MYEDCDGSGAAAPASEVTMRYETMAFAALLLVGGYGSGMAQSNAPAINTTPTATATPSGPGAPTVAPSGSQMHDPMVNPNAAGTQTGRERSGSTAANAEHSGSQTPTPTRIR